MALKVLLTFMLLTQIFLAKCEAKNQTSCPQEINDYLVAKIQCKNSKIEEEQIKTCEDKENKKLDKLQTSFNDKLKSHCNELVGSQDCTLDQLIQKCEKLRSDGFFVHKKEVKRHVAKFRPRHSSSSGSSSSRGYKSVEKK